MQKYRKIKKLKPIEFRRLTSVRPETFQEMVAILQDAEKKRMSRGGKPHRLKLNESRIEIINRNIFILGKRKDTP